MTVDNSALLAELLGKLEDKEAASIWGPIAQEAAKEDGERPTYWSHKTDGKVVGKITKLSQKQNYEKNGMNPVLDLDVDGKRVIVEAQHLTLKKALAKHLPQTGDWVSIECKGKAKGKNYYLYEVQAGKSLEALSDEVPF